MNSEPREPAVLESYATFWDLAPRAALHLITPDDDAYSMFMNLSEDEFPDEEWQLVSRMETDLA
jgi:hypothetical protein